MLAFARRDEYAAAVSSVGPALDRTPPVTPALLFESARYVLGGHLAQGGMASLFLGQRLAAGGIERPVVLKRLRPELCASAEARALFLREARLLSRLDHPAIVRCLDLTEIEGVPYLVLEYVRGGDLRLIFRRIRRRGLRVGMAAALYIARELLCALDHAHRLCLPDGRPLRVVHRDVSPNNILLSIHGEVKLSDFGIAQAEDPFGKGPQARGQIGYMSPEQARGEEIDARADLFSLTAVLYELLTNRRLFVGQVGQSAAEVYAERIVPPSQLVAEFSSDLASGLAAELDAVLLRALSLQPDGRPAGARALYLDLIDLCRRHKLWMDRAELADHLIELCGPDPGQWATLEERTATAVISPLARLAETTGPSHSHPVLPLSCDELSGALITIPWPTLGRSTDGATEGDGEADEETLTWQSRAASRGPLRLSEPRRGGLPSEPDADPEAVTRPAERTSPEEALLDGSLPVPPDAKSTGRAVRLERASKRSSRRRLARFVADNGLSVFLWILVMAGTVWLVLRWRVGPFTD